MIIKVRGSDKTTESWRYYEAHEIQWGEEQHLACVEEMEQVDPACIQCEMFEDVDIDTTKNGVFVRICFFDQNNEARHVYTNTRTFLLNNEGKTIDRIN